MMMVTATSCDNKQAQGTDKNIAQDSLAPGVIVASDTVAPDSTTPDSATANLTEYVNAKYGYQVKVPAQMRCTDRPPMAEGANYALGGDDVMNMMSLFCSENYGGKAFTPSEKESELKELASQLAQDAGAKVEQQTDEQGNQFAHSHLQHGQEQRQVEGDLEVRIHATTLHIEHAEIMI